MSPPAPPLAPAWCSVIPANPHCCEPCRAGSAADGTAGLLTLFFGPFGGLAAPGPAPPCPAPPPTACRDGADAEFAFLAAAIPLPVLVLPVDADAVAPAAPAPAVGPPATIDPAEPELVEPRASPDIETFDPEAVVLAAHLGTIIPAPPPCWPCPAFLPSSSALLACLIESAASESALPASP